jgi:hypothetical protein
MSVNPLGLIIPPVIWTAVDILGNYTFLRGKGHRANSLYFQVLGTNLGNIYIGKEILNPLDDATVVAVLPPPTANNLPDIAFDMPACPNPFLLEEFRVACDNAGDGVRVSFTEW